MNDQFLMFETRGLEICVILFTLLSIVFKIKRKFYPCIKLDTTPWRYTGNWRCSSIIFSLCTRWRRVLSFTLRPLIDLETGWAPEPVSTPEKGKISYPCRELNPGFSVCSLVAVQEREENRRGKTFISNCMVGKTILWS